MSYKKSPLEPAVIYLLSNNSGSLAAKSCLTLATPWTVACQAPLSMGFYRQEYCSGLPFPFPGDLPDPEIEPRSPALQAESLPTELHGKLYHLCSTLKYIANLMASFSFV